MKNENRRLIILRGLPGSGKSTLAKQLVGDNGIIHSTDNFHYVNGEYQFQEEELARFHTLNLLECIKSMKKNISPIIIDNTNIGAIHCKEYVEAARYYNYEITFMEPDTSWKFNIDKLAKCNTHNTPRHVIERMLEFYEDTDTIKKKFGIK